jgi:hypothetical protein
MSRIGRQQETLAQVVDRLEGAVGPLLQLAQARDLPAGGSNLAMALPGDEVRRELALRYGHDRGLLVAAFEGAGLAVDISGQPPASREPVLELAESAERLRALRSGLRAS